MTDSRLSILISDIVVPADRIRPVDEAAAHALAALIAQQGQLSPVAVYRSSRMDRPYTLIYGARRLRAMELMSIARVDAVLRTKADAAILTVTDNLSAAALNALEYGEHLAEYKELWKQKLPTFKKGLQTFQFETFARDHDFLEKAGFYKHLTEIFGISRTTAWRLLKVGMMTKELRDALRGTDAAGDRQSLLKFAKLEPRRQSQTAASMREGADWKAALAYGQSGFDPPMAVPPTEPSDDGYAALIAAWRAAGPNARNLLRVVNLMEVERQVPYFAAPPKWANTSPLAETVALPFDRLVPRFSAKELAKAQALQAAEDAAFFAQAQALEDAREAERLAAEAKKLKHERARAKQPKRGRKPKTPEEKRVDAFRRDFIRPLADVLIEHSVPLTAPAVPYLRRQSDEDQYVAACFIGNGHGYGLDDIKWKIARAKEA